MELKAAKELAHIRSWLGRVDEIVRRGKEAYLADELLQEAGDSLMMKLGEAANRFPTQHPGARRCRVGARGRESQLHHSSVRRDQPPPHLADALDRSARVETLPPGIVRRRRCRARRWRLIPRPTRQDANLSKSRLSKSHYAGAT